ncbi:hypothetical protein Tco_0473248 [Tanacetum coccineum]
MVILNDEIKASDDYLNHVAKSLGTKLVKSQGNGLITKKGNEVAMEKIEKLRVPKKKRLETVTEETCQSKELADEVNTEETESDDEEGH